MILKTKWEHKFHTKAELRAFKQGLEFMKGNLDVFSDEIIDQVDLDNFPEIYPNWFYVVFDKKTKESNIEELDTMLNAIEWSHFTKCGEDKTKKLLIKIADKDDNTLIMIRCHNQTAYLRTLELLNEWENK